MEFANKGNEEPKMVIGVDIGNINTVIVQNDGDIVLEPTGSQNRVSAVGFERKVRNIGEAAVPHLFHKDTVKLFPSLLGRSMSEVDVELAKYMPNPFDDAQKSDALCSVSVGYVPEGDNEKSTFTSTEIFGMYLAKLRSVMPAPATSLAFSVPISLPPSVEMAYRQAAQIAGMSAIEANQISLIPTDEALLACLKRKIGKLHKDAAEDEIEHSLIVSIGAVRTTIVVVKRLGATLSCLVSKEDISLGSMHFDIAIVEHFVSTKKVGEVVPGSKRGLRLMKGVERLKKLLSQIKEASTTVENLSDDGDITLNMSRNQLVECSSDLLGRLEALITTSLTEAGIKTSDISGIELVGGGSRMVVIHESILSKLFGSIPLHAKLDDTSCALGAALVASEEKAIDNNDSISRGEESETVSLCLTDEQLAASIEYEKVMQCNDAEASALFSARNDLEALCFKWKEAVFHPKHGKLIDRTALETVLSAAEMWLYDNCEASMADVVAQTRDLEEKVAGLTADFVKAQAEEQSTVEAELDKIAKDAEAERQASGEADEDHDTRKLPKKERMRMVMKNKEEGTELFKGGNWRMAGARYQKALQHASKFFDLSPDDEKEVKDVKLSLYLNLSMIYIKISSWEQVLRNTGDALDIDSKNAKAYFRRSQAYEAKKQWDKALDDLKLAAEYSPKLDGNIDKATTRVKKEIAKEKAKEKKMYKGVFG